MGRSPSARTTALSETNRSAQAPLLVGLGCVNPAPKALAAGTAGWVFSREGFLFLHGCVIIMLSSAWRAVYGAQTHKIWLAVLLVLLIAAIAAVVYLNSERAASDAQLASASAQLEEERGKYLTLEESLAEATAQSEQLTADKEALEAELSTVEASLTEAQAALDEAQTQLSGREEEWRRK